jgi:hypothetical protein
MSVLIAEDNVAQRHYLRKFNNFTLPLVHLNQTEIESRY